MMAGSCCGGASKSEQAHVLVAPVLKTTEKAAEQQVANSECCTEKSSAKGEKQSCGC